MPAVILGVLKSLASQLMAKKMLEWLVKYLVVSALEVAIKKYSDAAAKSEDKTDDLIAAKLTEGLAKIKEAWDA